MKKELTEKRLKKLLDKVRTKRVKLLRGPRSPESFREFRSLKKTIWRALRSWILDGHTRNILSEFHKILEDDLRKFPLENS